MRNVEKEVPYSLHILSDGSGFFSSQNSSRGPDSRVHILFNFLYTYSGAVYINLCNGDVWWLRTSGLIVNYRRGRGNIHTLNTNKDTYKEGKFFIYLFYLFVHNYGTV